MASDITHITVDDSEVFRIQPLAAAMWFYYALAYPMLIASGVMLGSLGGEFGVLLGSAVSAWIVYLLHSDVIGRMAPVELRVVPEGLRVSNGIGHANTLFPRFDIAELSLWDPRAQMNPIVPSFVTDARTALTERRLELRLRKRSHSKVVTIAGGLTRDSSCVLLNDLRSALGTRSTV